MSKREYVLSWILIVLAILATLYLRDEYTGVQAIAPASLPAAAIVPSVTIHDPAEYFHDVTILAESAIVYDVTDRRILYSKDVDTVRPLASITKIMSVTAARELIQSETVTIPHTPLVDGPLATITAGEEWLPRDLYAYTLMSSSNDGAEALAQIAGESCKCSVVGYMNHEAAALGLTDMHFNNPTGLDVSADTAGAVGTAKDVVEFFVYAYLNHPELFSQTIVENHEFVSLSGTHHSAVNTDEITESVGGLLASKTGFTELAQGNLAILYKTSNGHIIVCVVLGSTRDGRFTDTLSLYERTQKYLND